MIGWPWMDAGSADRVAALPVKLELPNAWPCGPDSDAIGSTASSMRVDAAIEANFALAIRSTV